MFGGVLEHGDGEQRRLPAPGRASAAMTIARPARRRRRAAPRRARGRPRHRRRPEVVAEAADGLEAVELCREHSPDVVLMDVRMPGIDGIEATRRLVAARPDIKILILTTFHDDEYVYGALRAGASGFLLKRASPERLLDAVHTVAAGDALLDPAVTREPDPPVPGHGRDRRPRGASAETRRPGPAHRARAAGAAAGGPGPLERARSPTCW